MAEHEDYTQTCNLVVSLPQMDVIENKKSIVEMLKTEVYLFQKAKSSIIQRLKLGRYGEDESEDDEKSRIEDHCLIKRVPVEGGPDIVETNYHFEDCTKNDMLEDQGKVPWSNKLVVRQNRVSTNRTCNGKLTQKYLVGYNKGNYSHTTNILHGRDSNTNTYPNRSRYDNSLYPFASFSSRHPSKILKSRLIVKYSPYQYNITENKPMNHSHIPCNSHSCVNINYMKSHLGRQPILEAPSNTVTLLSPDSMYQQEIPPFSDALQDMDSVRNSNTNTRYPTPSPNGILNRDAPRASDPVHSSQNSIATYDGGEDGECDRQIIDTDTEVDFVDEFVEDDDDFIMPDDMRQFLNKHNGDGQSYDPSALPESEIFHLQNDASMKSPYVQNSDGHFAQNLHYGSNMGYYKLSANNSLQGMPVQNIYDGSCQNMNGTCNHCMNYNNESMENIQMNSISQGHMNTNMPTDLLQSLQQLSRENTVAWTHGQNNQQSQQIRPPVHSFQRMMSQNIPDSNNTKDTTMNDKIMNWNMMNANKLPLQIVPNMQIMPPSQTPIMPVLQNVQIIRISDSIFMDNLNASSAENFKDYNYSFSQENLVQSPPLMSNLSSSQASCYSHALMNIPNMDVNDMNSNMTLLVEENKYLSRRH